MKIFRLPISIMCLSFFLVLIMSGIADTQSTPAKIPPPAIVKTVTYFESFEDDFVAGRSVPDGVAAGLSSPFSAINDICKSPTKLTIRDREVYNGGIGGGFPPLNGWARLDFACGGGTYVTFGYSPGGKIISGTISFDITNFAGDSNALHKYVSSDGVNFTQVGDNSDTGGAHTFDLAAGGTETFFRIQEFGNGIWMDNFRAVIEYECSIDTVVVSEGFEDDFVAGWSVPNTVDRSLSSPFSAINDNCITPRALTIRDREVHNGGIGGGFPPLYGWARLDFACGGGTYVTFGYSPGGEILSGTISFDVTNFANDSHAFFKYVSSDGVNFTQVGDNSDIVGTYTYDLKAGETTTFFKLQEFGNGIWVDNFVARIAAVSCGCPGNIVESPVDIIIPPHSTIPYLPLGTFRIFNPYSTSMAFDYHLTSLGPATLGDCGDPSSLAGTTPLLAPGEYFVPPEAALATIPPISGYSHEIVTCVVTRAGVPDLEDCGKITITFEPPVAVLINNFTANSMNSGIELAWDISADEMIKGFKIHRMAEDEQGYRPINHDNLLPPEQRKYIDDSVLPDLLYKYTLSVVREDGSTVQSRVVTVEKRANEAVLQQNYPNPFNPATTISFVLPGRQRTNLTIFDVEGKLVKVLIDGILDEGLREITWDGTDRLSNPVGSGVYFYILKAGKHTLTKKMVIIK